MCAGFLPRSISQRHSRLPDERHHVPDLRTVPAVLPEPLGQTEGAAGERVTNSLSVRGFSSCERAASELKLTEHKPAPDIADATI